MSKGSKLQKDLVTSCIDKVFAFAEGESIVKDGVELQGKKRNFQETIELQVWTLTSFVTLERC